MASFGRGLAWFVGTVVVVGLGAKVLLVDPWTIPDEIGGFAQPTLGPGDLVLVGKREDAAFGDLVRCAAPEDGRPVIGRIAGGPGDRLEIEGRSLRVNGASIDSKSACPVPRQTIEDPRNGQALEISCDLAEMAGGWHYRGYAGNPLGGGTLEKTVPAGRVFLVSDLRDIHDDSRDVGPVQPETCRRIYFRLWSKAGWKDDVHRLTLVR